MSGASRRQQPRHGSKASRAIYLQTHAARIPGPSQATQHRGPRPAVHDDPRRGHARCGDLFQCNWGGNANCFSKEVKHFEGASRRRIVSRMQISPNQSLPPQVMQCRDRWPINGTSISARGAGGGGGVVVGRDGVLLDERLKLTASERGLAESDVHVSGARTGSVRDDAGPDGHTRNMCSHQQLGEAQAAAANS